VRGSATLPDAKRTSFGSRWGSFQTYTAPRQQGTGVGPYAAAERRRLKPGNSNSGNPHSKTQCHSLRRYTRPASRCNCRYRNKSSLYNWRHKIGRCPSKEKT
jgi:hypothetical protein